MDSRLYVGNLSDDVSIEMLRQRFAECGHVADVHLAEDRQSGRVRGHAFVTMGTAEEARNAVRKLNGARFDDRRLRVNIAGEREHDAASRRALKDAARITSQFRERHDSVYELDCAGVALRIKMVPEDNEKAWRVEVTVRRAEATPIDVTGAGATKREAFEHVTRLWNANGNTAQRCLLEWPAIEEALHTVRAF